MKSDIFSGTIPALMTPCKADRTPDFDTLVAKAKDCDLLVLGTRRLLDNLRARLRAAPDPAIPAPAVTAER